LQSPPVSGNINIYPTHKRLSLHGKKRAEDSNLLEHKAASFDWRFLTFLSIEAPPFSQPGRPDRVHLDYLTLTMKAFRSRSKYRNLRAQTLSLTSQKFGSLQQHNCWHLKTLTFNCFHIS